MLQDITTPSMVLGETKSERKTVMEVGIISTSSGIRDPDQNEDSLNY